MLVALTLALAFQSVEVRIGAKDQADSVKRQAARDSARYVELERMRDRNRRPVRRIPVTPELERTAFKDSAARTLLLRARVARLEQDSSLLSYDAHATQRMSVGIGVKAVGRNRLLLRTENASRVRWSRANGVHIELKGERAVFPAVKDAESEVNMRDALPIPYYPGRDALWIGSGSGRVKAEVDENELIHPLATGAEAYYRYATGDSLTITLAPGNAIRLRELRIEPRRPEWKLSVGSFWFDMSSGQLVRAVYRMSVPMDIWGVVDEEMERDREEARARGGKPPTNDEVPPVVKGLMSPMKASLEAVTIEYGLYGGRFWLPRSQTAEGWAQASFMRIPFSMQEGFRYESVNGADTTPSTPSLMTRREMRDSLFGGDSTHWSDLTPEVRKERVAMLVHADSLRRARQRAQRETDCASTGFYTRVDSRDDGTLRTSLRIPCDSTVLLTSPELPPSIYDAGEELFGVAARDELLKELDFSLQATWAPRPVRLAYGPTLWRYNRVEGLSAAVSATQELGQGYAWDGTARLGMGDWSPNVTVGASRSNGRLVWRLGGYRRLAVANDDWGTPLSFGASLGSVLYARDEGYYFRATGIELTRSPARGGGFTTRLFVERQGAVETNVAF
ncbi:MAG: hypothetical protein ABIZ91_13105, partial [Gemmatimonadaceae bacterium]